MATVLLAEDDPDIRALLQLRLRRAGHDVLAAGSGEEALHVLVDRDPPDIAVLDVLMPGMTGLDLLARLRQDPVFADMPAIFLSGRVSTQDEAAGRALGAGYLGKPVVLAQLVQAIADALAPATSAAGGG